VQPPFARASIWRNSLYVQLTAATPLESVVRVPIAPLRGGMTLDVASGVAGEPTSSRVDSIGTYYSFGPEALRMELAHLQYRDSGPVDKWVVKAAPKDSTVMALLSPELNALVARTGGVEELTVHEHKRANLQAFTARVQRDRLVDLQWYSIQGIPGE